jgi:NADH:ubiquinone oxidoreductase subunit 5 (subunit L)/multisubunit Na+/H+ antiporter MnhA subunit
MTVGIRELIMTALRLKIEWATIIIVTTISMIFAVVMTYDEYNKQTHVSINDDEEKHRVHILMLYFFLNLVFGSIAIAYIFQSMYFEIAGFISFVSLLLLGSYLGEFEIKANTIHKEETKKEVILEWSWHEKQMLVSNIAKNFIARGINPSRDKIRDKIEMMKKSGEVTGLKIDQTKELNPMWAETKNRLGLG